MHCGGCQEVCRDISRPTNSLYEACAVNTEKRILLLIQQQTGNVIFRSEVVEMGSASQVSKALRSLQEKSVLVRISTGVYAKTRKSSVTGAVIPAGSLETLAIEIFKKLGICVKAGRAAAAYNSGATSQLPGVFVVNTGPRRIYRKITVGGRFVAYENDYCPTERRLLNAFSKE